MNWERSKTESIYEQPLLDLLFQAQTVHRQHFTANQIQVAALLNIKTGACPEDCGYCSQSGHFKTGLKKSPLMDLETVKTAAAQAKANGATRFCLGAAWRHPPQKQFETVLEMITAIKKLGMEACVTLGMINDEQAQALKSAGLDFYNHNLDTSREYYDKVVTTRSYDERLDTLACVRQARINVCCGGILGLGESRSDRMGLLMELANLPEYPTSVPINKLMRVEGTPLGNSPDVDNLELVRTIATARIMMPKATVRLTAGRTALTEEVQALCFMAGANSIFAGDTLLTTPNPELDDDARLFSRLGLYAHAI